MPLARRPLSGYAWKTTLFSLPPAPRGQITATREGAWPRRNRRRSATRRATRARARTRAAYLPPLAEPFNGICIVCKLTVFMVRMPSVHWHFLFLSSRGGGEKGGGRGGEQGYREQFRGRAHKNNSIPPKRQCRRLSDGSDGTERTKRERREGEREIEERTFELAEIALQASKNKTTPVYPGGEAGRRLDTVRLVVTPFKRI